MQGSKLPCTMKSEKGSRKDATPGVTQVYGAIVIAGVKGKADARMCVVCWGYTTHVERGKKEKFCMCNRFSADGFRTRAARVIRRRVLGVRVAKGKTGEERGNVQVIPGRGKSGVCVCV